MDTQLLSYRLKSARRKKRLVKEDRDKQLLRLDREQDQIWNNPDYKTTIALEEPYQKGWKRLFVLTTDVQKSDKAEFYQKILDQVNMVQYHYDESFKKPRRKGRWHRYNFEELPKLRGIDRYDWGRNKHHLSEEQRAWFNKVEYWNQYRYQWDYYFAFAMPEILEIKVLPNMITTITTGDAVLEQRLAWIDNHITNNALQFRLYKLKDGNRYKGWKDGSEKKKYLNPLKNKAKCEWCGF